MTGPRPRAQVILTAQGAILHLTAPGAAVRDFVLTEADTILLLEQADAAVLHLRTVARRSPVEEPLPHFLDHIEG